MARVPVRSGILEESVSCAYVLLLWQTWLYFALIPNSRPFRPEDEASLLRRRGNVAYLLRRRRPGAA